MERLTIKLQGNCGLVRALHTPGSRVQEAIERLATYEDTGLEPEEITTERPACVFYCNRKCNLDGDWCPEGPGCPRELSPEAATALLSPPNPPLTLEELREMDEDPVWIERMGDVLCKDSAWAFVNVERCICRTADGSPAYFDFYGRTWLAYRRKPEEGTT